ncbi:MAG TPA: VWA domain-containing protein [Terriglobia bacterium]|nr:VWA domain-containing protein [Terriglobia bacterium]
MQKLGVARVAIMVFAVMVSAAAAVPQGKDPEAPLPGATGTLNGDPFRLRVDVNLAQVDVVVQDRAGRSIQNLRASDFRLFENGVERPIQAFSRDERPLATAFVLERSRMDDFDRQFGRSIKSVASQSLALLQRGDSACLFVFSYTVEMLQGLTTDLKRVTDDIGPIIHTAGAGIPLTKGGVYDAVHEATAYLARTAPDKRRAVILFSDNRDYHSESSDHYVPDMFPLPVSLDQTIQLAIRNETVVYSVRPPDRTPRSSVCCGGDINPRLIQETGGKSFEGSPAAIEKALASAIGQLKSGYTLGFEPGNGVGNTRRIDVRLVDRFGKPDSDYRILAGSSPFNEPPVDNGVSAPPKPAPPKPLAQAGAEIEFVRVASGRFTMGFDPGYKFDFTTPHKVTLTKGFELGRFEVTQAQWQAVMGNNPSNYQAGSNPVNNVSWNEIQEFIRRMNSRKDGYRYRLPTEAEWEYSARAGTTDFGMGGDKWYGQLDEIGWYAGNSAGQLHPVGQKKPNAWGLYDMYGNVWEWVADWYGADYYNQSVSRNGGAVLDPQGPTSGKSRVLRGGSWNYLSEHAYVVGRWHSAPENHSSAVGFRLLRERP